MAIRQRASRNERAVEISAYEIGSGIPLYARDFCVQAPELAASGSISGAKSEI
jgi:hypothetical protein